MPIVRLGHSDGRVTTANVPDDGSRTDHEMFLDITNTDGPTGGVWDTHKHLSGSDRPAWVESSDPDFAQTLADHFGCSIGQPAENEC